ncbi:MAG: HD-GYP domain-containing protein [Candidatus Caldatribacteriaceae bacterium]
MSERNASKAASLYFYIIVVSIVGGTLFGYSLLHLDLVPRAWWILVTFSISTLLAELVPVYFLDGKTAISVSFALVYASILLSSPFLATVIAFLGIFGATVFEKWYRGFFNASQFAISTFLAGMVFQVFQGYRYEFVWGNYHFYLAIVSSIVIFFLCNASLVLGAVSLQSRIPFRVFWKKDVNGILIQYFALFPLSVLLYFAYVNVGFVGMALFFFPLMVARYSFKLFVDTKRMHMELLRALTAAVDAKDPYTRGHSSRVSQLSLWIAEKMGLSEKRRELLEYAAILHDVGKIGVADAILSKNGRLSVEEYQIIKEHPVIGHRIVGGVDFLKEVAEIVLAHHERCDGRGYPYGKTDEKIPLEAKIVAAADVFDALTSERPYRRAYTVEEAFQVMENEEEGHFAEEVFLVLKTVIKEKGWPPDAG